MQIIDLDHFVIIANDKVTLRTSATSSMDILNVSIKDHNNNNNTRFNKGRNVIANAVTNVEEGEKLELQGESQGQNVSLTKEQYG